MRRRFGSPWKNRERAIKQKKYGVEYANLKAAVDSKREILNKLMQRETETGSLPAQKRDGQRGWWILPRFPTIFSRPIRR
jgi:hypothetical protein